MNLEEHCSKPLPLLTTDRLCLRPFSVDDAPDVQRLAGRYAIAADTATIPHPYPDGFAETWIDSHVPLFEQQKEVNWAIASRETNELYGAINVRLRPEHRRAEIAYWIGEPYWNQGYCTEAAIAVVDYCFNHLNFNRVQALYYSDNLASGRVIQKLGMQPEGYLRQYSCKWGQYRDVSLCSILQSEWQVRSP